MRILATIEKIRKNKEEKIIEHELERMISLVIATFFLALAINLVYDPLNLVVGGVTGIGIILHHYIPWELTYLILILNIIVILISAFTEGEAFTLKALITSAILLPIFMKLIPDQKIANNLLEGAIAGGVLQGISTALLVYCHGSTGGVTVLAKIVVDKIPQINFPLAIALIDGLIILIGGYTFGISKIFYGILALIIATVVSETMIKYRPDWE